MRRATTAKMPGQSGWQMQIWQSRSTTRGEVCWGLLIKLIRAIDLSQIHNLFLNSTTSSTFIPMQNLLKKPFYFDRNTSTCTLSYPLCVFKSLWSLSCTSTCQKQWDAHRPRSKRSSNVRSTGWKSRKRWAAYPRTNRGKPVWCLFDTCTFVQALLTPSISSSIKLQLLLWYTIYSHFHCPVSSHLFVWNNLLNTWWVVWDNWKFFTKESMTAVPLQRHIA